jgi:IclR family transcriptional regulator, acetate operon repressor
VRRPGRAVSRPDGADSGPERDRSASVQSIDRATAILRCFAVRRTDLTLSEIARATGLTTSTAHRLLGAMHKNQLVRQTADRRYSPGPLLVQLVRGGTVTRSLREAALPAMTAFRDEAEETVGLHALLPTDERVVVDQVESHQALRRTYTELGLPIPLPHGAPGKVLCAHLPPDRRDVILSRPIQQLTPTTVTDPVELRAQLDEVRRCGYAISFSERTPGIRTVAAPVFDHHGGGTACISLSGPEMRMPAERMRALGPQVREVAWTVSEILGATLDVVRARSADPPGDGGA